MYLKHSSKEPTIVDALSHKGNMNAKIVMDNAIKSVSTLRQVVLFSVTIATGNVQNREPLFLVLENSRLEVISSAFKENYSTTQGCIVKADYRRA